MRGGQAWEGKAGGEGFVWKKRRRRRPRGMEEVEEEEEGESRLTPVSLCVVVCLSGFPLPWRQLEMPPLSRGSEHIILHSPPFSPPFDGSNTIHAQRASQILSGRRLKGGSESRGS